jgi:hypothetical protein
MTETETLEGVKALLEVAIESGERQLGILEALGNNIDKIAHRVDDLERRLSVLENRMNQ